MELGGRRWQVAHDRLVELERHLREYGDRGPDAVSERLQVPGQDRLVDVIERRLARQRHVEDAEERDEARVHVVTSAARLTHRRHIVQVLHTHTHTHTHTS